MDGLFKVGDKLAVLDTCNTNREIFEIERMDENGCVYDTRSRRIYLEFFRLASREEIRNNQRSY